MTGPVFPEDSWVQVRYPLTREQEHGDRAGWPWLPGWVAARCGPDEWEICVQAPDLATWHEGEAWYPTCFRDSSELRPPEAQADMERPDGPELEGAMSTTPRGPALTPRTGSRLAPAGR